MVGRERRHAVLTVRVDVVWASARGQVQVLIGNLAVVFALDLGSRGGEQVNRART